MKAKVVNLSQHLIDEFKVKGAITLVCVRPGSYELSVANICTEEMCYLAKMLEKHIIEKMEPRQIS